MDNLQTLDELFRHMEWADSIVWEAALGLKDEAQGDKALRERLHHIHTVQLAFLSIWKGEDVRWRPLEDFEDLRAILPWARQSYRELNEYRAGLPLMDLERPVVMPWAGMIEARIGRKAAAPTFHETLLQVAMHSTYHRGQVNTRLRELGAEPPLTDFIAWVWSSKPEARWP